MKNIEISATNLNRLLNRLLQENLINEEDLMRVMVAESASSGSMKKSISGEAKEKAGHSVDDNAGGSLNEPFKAHADQFKAHGKMLISKGALFLNDLREGIRLRAPGRETKGMEVSDITFKLVLKQFQEEIVILHGDSINNNYVLFYLAKVL